MHIVPLPLSKVYYFCGLYFIYKHIFSHCFFWLAELKTHINPDYPTKKDIEHVQKELFRKYISLFGDTPMWSL